jgi:hypothetical protein
MRSIITNFISIALLGQIEVSVFDRRVSLAPTGRVRFPTCGLQQCLTSSPWFWNQRDKLSFCVVLEVCWGKQAYLDGVNIASHECSQFDSDWHSWNTKFLITWSVCCGQVSWSLLLSVDLELILQVGSHDLEWFAIARMKCLCDPDPEQSCIRTVNILVDLWKCGVGTAEKVLVLDNLGIWREIIEGGLF